ncbi:DUF4339 domain-containing protein [Granulicella arctica]|uniref:DUF4339 domain-containing protein n=1 Tax=Granulicella arctica TaxID=940613 RepID=UPI0021E07732|nr:DUF4339 domain-containing protein [Granulicella arctica]
MRYHVSRNGQMYGPYTLEDLQHYVRSGNVLLTDLAKNEAMLEWIPVEQILGSVGTGNYSAVPPIYSPNTAPPATKQLYPDPPNLSWVLVLLFSILTCGLFMVIWDIVIAAWIKRVQPNSQGLLYYIAGAVLLFINSGASFGLFYAFHHHHSYGHHPFAGVLGVAAWIIRIVALFMMKASLEEHFNGPDPIGLRLSGVMTFLFGGLYLQYHLSRINEVKYALRFRRVAI